MPPVCQLRLKKRNKQQTEKRWVENHYIKTINHKSMQIDSCVLSIFDEFVA